MLRHKAPMWLTASSQLCNEMYSSKVQTCSQIIQYCYTLLLGIEVVGWFDHDPLTMHNLQAPLTEYSSPAAGDSTSLSPAKAVAGHNKVWQGEQLLDIFTVQGISQSNSLIVGLETRVPHDCSKAPMRSPRRSCRNFGWKKCCNKN